VSHDGLGGDTGPNKVSQGVNIDKGKGWRNVALGLAMILACLVGWWLGGIELPLAPPIVPPTATATLTLTATPSPSSTATSSPTATPTQTATPTPRPTLDVSTLIYDVYLPLVFRAAP